MPVQWKIFRIVNYLIIIPSALIILALIISTGLQFYTDFAILSFIFISTCGIIVIVNCIINHLWLDRYYPENYPGKAFRNFSAVFFVLMTLVLLLFTWLFITSVYDLFVEENVVSDWSEYLAFGLSGFIITCGFYLLVCRVKIRRLVRRNQQRLFNNFLEANN